MKMNLIYIIGILIITLPSYSQTNISKKDILTQVWTKEKSPYIIQNNVRIPKSNTLTIEPGVILEIDGNIEIYGTIKSLGTKENPIIFKSTNFKQNDYFILNGTDDSELSYCTFNYFKGVEFVNCSIRTANNIIIKNCINGLLINRSNAEIINSLISDCELYGIFIKNKSNIILENNLIKNCKKGGLIVDNNSILKINYTNILNNKRALISTPAGTSLKYIEINNSIVWNNEEGLCNLKVRSLSNIKRSILQNHDKSTNKLLSRNNIIGTPKEIPDFEKIIKFNHFAFVEIEYNSFKWEIGIRNDNNSTTSNLDQIKPNNYVENIKNPSPYMDVGSNTISDVDHNIPYNSKSNDYRFALIIGNEDYTKYQTNLTSEVNADFAINDAEIFAKYCKNVLGVPEENIFLLKNAIGTEIKREVNKISKIMMYTQGKAEVIFYYAGHGIPHETSKESYLIPVDVSAQNIEDGVKLSWLYKKLTEYNSKFVLVFLDACFTGGARNQGLLAARGVKIKPKENIIQGSCIAFTSSSDIQSSLPYKEKQHGMFTYHLLKKLQESNGNITLGELSDYLYEKVALSSLKVNSKEQTPKTLVSPSLKDNWKQIKLVE